MAAMALSLSSSATSVTTLTTDFLTTNRLPTSQLISLFSTSAQQTETRESSLPSTLTTSRSRQSSSDEISSLASSRTSSTATTSKPSTGFNGTGESCNAASVSFLKEYGTTYIHDFLETVTNSDWVFRAPTDTPYTTLCDGLPRAHGTPYFHEETFTTSFPWSETLTSFDSATATPPSCTIDKSACSRLWASYYSATATDNARPACKDPQCSLTACNVLANTVELAYWPTSVGGDMCKNRTEVPTTITTPPATATIFGTTVVSPNVLISFDAIYLRDKCDTTFSTIRNYVLEQRPDQVSSQRGRYHAGAIEGFQVDFKDFVHPIPWSAYQDLPMCNGGNEAGGVPNYCSTIWDDIYTPVLAIPTDVLKLAPPESSCVFGVFENIAYDPPIALSAAVNDAAPTLPNAPSQGRTTTSAGGGPTFTAEPVKTPDPPSSPATTSSAPVATPTLPAPQSSTTVELPEGPVVPPSSSIPPITTTTQQPGLPVEESSPAAQEPGTSPQQPAISADPVTLPDNTVDQPDIPGVDSGNNVPRPSASVDLGGIIISGIGGGPPPLSATPGQTVPSALSVLQQAQQTQAVAIPVPSDVLSFIPGQATTIDGQVISKSGGEILMNGTPATVLSSQATSVPPGSQANGTTTRGNGLLGTHTGAAESHPVAYVSAGHAVSLRVLRVVLGCIVVAMLCQSF